MAKQFVKLGSATDVPEGQMALVELGDRSLLLCNVGGEFFALDNVCTHDGGSLDEGSLDGHAVECPRHGALFDLRSGEALSLPAVVGVNAYDVRVNGNDIEIGIGDR